MSQEDELIELNSVYHNCRSRMAQLEAILREYVSLLEDYRLEGDEKQYFFRATEEERDALQKRAKKLLAKVDNEKAHSEA